MSIRKKKNIIILTICMVICFTVYQLYFFLSITSASAGSGVVPVFEHEMDFEMLTHVRPESDKYINSNGVIKGVLYYNMPRYRPNPKGEFQCLNSEQFVPFEQVNDDYCDCEDSSDEPSTDACVNGSFYCDSQSSNKRVPPNMVPSNRINDGICDCCDGSDEWIHESGTLLLSQANDRYYRYYGKQCLNSC